MNLPRLAVVAGVLLLSAACGARQPDETAFIERFRQAHASRDIDAALALVHLEGVETDVKENLVGSFRDSFLLTVQHVELAAVPADQTTEYSLQGQTFKTNLDVKKVLHVSFAPQPGVAQVTSTRYLVGEADGEYRITTAVPVR